MLHLSLAELFAQRAITSPNKYTAVDPVWIFADETLFHKRAFLKDNFSISRGCSFFDEALYDVSDGHPASN